MRKEPKYEYHLKTFDVAKYTLKWKWTCGFNDYPLGEDFDYDNNHPKIIQEWITGADQQIDNM
jgi:hypothetical protein